MSGVNSMIEQNDDVPPLDPAKVAVFMLLLGLIAFAGWRLWRTQSAVTAAASVAKDYKKLFPAHVKETPPNSVRRTTAPGSSIGMLRIDDDMRAPVPVLATAPAVPAAPAKAVPAQLVQPARKAFNQPRLNSSAFSRLNGGAGISYSGRATSGSGTPPVTNSATPALPDIPGMPVLPDIPGLPVATDRK